MQDCSTGDSNAMAKQTGIIDRFLTITTQQGLLYVLFPACLAIVCWYISGPDEEHFTCYRDFENNEAIVCQPKCPRKQFGLPWMDGCQPWLTCKEIESPQFNIVRPIGNGAVKMVYLAEWQEHKVVLNSLINKDYKEDFQHGLKMLVNLQGHPEVTQVLGHCKNSFVTQYHKFGSADQMEDILRSDDYKYYSTLEVRLALCISYAEVVAFLHNSPVGIRVMCDSNDLRKTLNQYLLRADFQLVANDLDALPKVNRTAGLLTRCGHRPLFGDFVAPEQTWPFENEEFDDNRMPPYDEKSDIWKIPDVCNYFLGRVHGSDATRFHLFKIHKQCKEENPAKRPNASEVLTVYKQIQEDMGL